MSRVEDRLDVWLENHERLDKIYTKIYLNTVYEARYAIRRVMSRWEMREFKPGGFFLDHGHTPAVITSIDDGAIRGVSMVDGNGVVSDWYACGPKITDEKTAWKLAAEQRVE